MAMRLHNEESSLLDENEAPALNTIFLQEQWITQAMGGPLPECADASTMRDVLDIGCGSGAWALALARQFPHLSVCGMDQNVTCIAFAHRQAQREKKSTVQFQVMEALEALPFANASFDLVNMRFAVGWLPSHQWHTLITEARRILRPGGLLRLSETDNLGVSTSFTYEQWGDLVAVVLSEQGYGFHPTGRSFAITPVLRPHLRSAGFLDIGTRPWMIDISHNDQPAVHLLLSFFDRLRGRLLQGGRVTREHLNQFEHQLREEMMQPWFEVLCFGLTIWGHKPLGEKEGIHL